MKHEQKNRPKAEHPLSHLVSTTTTGDGRTMIIELHIGRGNSSVSHHGVTRPHWRQRKLEGRQRSNGTGNPKK